MDAALEALLHPVRYGIVQHLTQEHLTPKQLQERMPQVAPATLYRHLATLVDSGLVTVVDEARIRGAVEKTYALGATLTDVPTTAEERLTQGALMLALLQSDVETAIRAVPDGRPLDGFTLTRTILHLTDEDRDDLQRHLAELLTPHLHPCRGTRPHSLGIVLVPQPETD